MASDEAGAVELSWEQTLDDHAAAESVLARRRLSRSVLLIGVLVFALVLADPCSCACSCSR